MLNRTFCFVANGKQMAIFSSQKGTNRMGQRVLFISLLYVLILVCHGQKENNSNRTCSGKAEFF
jgi:hypothetical protein